ncbi:EamA family transporter RarD [Zavarzinia sp. CC-PAN008]|uniref:EamA family transporter RarD n=1 Tax=Zavarzinia sp. CC-PAN008 TaxID=3243332 RepID=UPI003F74988D
MPASAGPAAAPADARREALRGGLWAAAAFTTWGLSPLFWRAFAGVDPVELIAWRAVFSAAFSLSLLLALGQMAELAALLRNRRAVATLLATGSLISVNWLIYVAAVAHGQVLEASLGYFINPLAAVALGMVVLRERLGGVQLAAVALAACGVGIEAVLTGSAPWIALGLAGTFAVYGLLRKQVGVGPLTGMAVESLVMLGPALLVLAWFAATDGLSLTTRPATIQALAVLTGPVTVLPLLAFAAAARRIRLATLGFIQYMSPTMMLLLGVLAFGEPLGLERLSGFVLIWAACALYSWATLRQDAASQAGPRTDVER